MTAFVKLLRLGCVGLIGTLVVGCPTLSAFILMWGSEGPDDGEFNTPYGVATDASGNVYVADTFNHRIQKFQ